MFINFVKNCLTILAVGFSLGLVSCSQSQPESVATKEKTTETRLQCTKKHNGSDRPCQISAYALTSDTAKKVSGLYVEIIVYYPGNNTKLLFLNKEAAEFEDYSSSFLVAGDSAQIESLAAGYVRAVAKFERDIADYGVGSGVYRQLGVVSSFVKVRPVISMSARALECKKLGCTVSYSDGIK